MITVYLFEQFAQVCLYFFRGNSIDAPLSYGQQSELWWVKAVYICRHPPHPSWSLPLASAPFSSGPGQTIFISMDSETEIIRKENILTDRTPLMVRL